MLELLKATNGGKNCLARRNRKRKDNDDFIKEILPLQPPRRPSKKRESQSLLNRHPFPGEKMFSFTTNTMKSIPSATADVVPSGRGKGDTIG